MSPGVLEVSEYITRLRAPNPSPMTLEGTNSYVVDIGGGNAAVIDPGPDDPTHVASLAAYARKRGLVVAAILVTHGHPDHAPGGALLKALTNAPVYAHPDARFEFDVGVEDGAAAVASERRLDAVFAPGHARDHLAFWVPGEGALFTGDVVIGRGTVVVAPPGGDMRTYQQTLRRLRAEFAHAAVIHGGHGEPVTDPVAKLDEYIAHRAAREAALLETLRELGSATVPTIVERLYVDTPQVLWPAAARQTISYLEALEREGRVRSSTLARPPTQFESSLLNPDLARITDAQTAAVARAELGFEEPGSPLVAYALV